jgi:threonine/homoserine efflux transporter RhtA
MNKITGILQKGRETRNIRFSDRAPTWLLVPMTFVLVGNSLRSEVLFPHCQCFSIATGELCLASVIFRCLVGGPSQPGNEEFFSLAQWQGDRG